ncbi:MAG: FUSC family protein, partial [Marmoricola sp.]
MSHPSHLDVVLSRGRMSLTARLHRLRVRGWQVGQCAAAAGVAWFVASGVFGHQTPFFAPIAAVVSLGTSYGQRLRRVGEVTIGVAIGVFLGDVLTQAIGSGAWQISLIVALAMCTALLLDAGQIFVTQAAVQSIVVSTLLPNPDAAFTRWSDALIGGAVALVAATAVPRAPLRRPREQAAVVVHKIAELLRAAADSIDDGDVERATSVLRDARSTDGLIRELQDAADEGLSVLASSPFRMRHRGGVRRMAELVEPMDYAMRNTRVLVRRVAVACY